MSSGKCRSMLEIKDRTANAKHEQVKTRIPELDGLRGCAILLILIWHYFQNQLSYELGWPIVYLRKLIGFTWSGVDLFFVLSGFLIAGLLLDNRTSPNYFKTFYVRRVCRIFPIYYLHLSLFALCSICSCPHSILSSSRSVVNCSNPTNNLRDSCFV